VRELRLEDDEQVIYGPTGDPISVVQVGVLVPYVGLDDGDYEFEDNEPDQAFGFLNAVSTTLFYGDGCS